MSYDPLANYWKDFFFKQIEWYKDVLKEHPGNSFALQEIEEYKRLLYKKFMIVVDDEPVQKPKPKQEQLELFD